MLADEEPEAIGGRVVEEFFDDDDDDLESLEDYPLDRNKHEWKFSMMRVPDLCYLVYDLCDDSSLLKLSMPCHYNRRQLMSPDPSNSRALLKGYLVRILNYKYKVAAT